MTVVFVHGFPDTAEVWDPLRSLIADRRTSALSLPGFGCPIPDGFSCTRWDYHAWLVAELERFEEPVHVVAHDLGCIALQRAIETHPHLLRSWVLSGAVCDASYGWHQHARMMQTTRLGEEMRDAWLAMDRDARVAALRAIGLPGEAAERAAATLDRTMFDAALAYYRSSAFFGDWELTASRSYPPGLVLWGEQDPYQDPAFGRRLAATAGASFAPLDCGHWWQLEQTERGAAVLRGFWESIEERKESA